jgi:hypothetical protein
MILAAKTLKHLAPVKGSHAHDLYCRVQAKLQARCACTRKVSMTLCETQSSQTKQAHSMLDTHCPSM